MKLAIIGTGMIVPVALEAIQQVESITVTSIFARPQSIEKGKEIAIQFSIPTVYTDYDKLLQTDECDTVYIANINPVHYEYAKQALENGKHVILEKPSCVHSWQTRELLSIAQQKKLFVFEAVTSIHNPNFHHIKEDIQKIGEIKLVQANYSQFSSRYNAYTQENILPAFDPKLYGGALYDVNVYNINVVVGLFGEPQAVQYNANIGYNGIDTSGTVFMRYPGFFAHCTAAKDSESPGHVTIQGDKGCIEVHGPTNTFYDYSLYFYDTKKETRHRYSQYEHRMVHEFMEFEEMIQNRDYMTMIEYLHNSIRVLEVIEIAAESAGINFG